MRFNDYRGDFGFDLSTIITDIGSGNISGAIGAAVGSSPPVPNAVVQPVTTVAGIPLTPMNMAFGALALGAVIYFATKKKGAAAA